MSGDPRTSTAENEPTVFVVDDDVPVRETIADLLRSVALRGVTFDSPHGILRTRQDPLIGPGCLVLDVRLAVQDRHGRIAGFVAADGNRPERSMTRPTKADAPVLGGFDLQGELTRANIDIRSIFVTDYGDMPVSVARWRPASSGP